MKVGDLVRRKSGSKPVSGFFLADNGVGIIISKHIAGNPPHKCIDVFYPKVGKAWSIAESLVEVISESR